MRRILKVLTSRLMIVGPLVLLQLALLIMLFYRVTIIYKVMPVVNILGIILAIYIINRSEDPSYKIAWSAIILAVPVIGVPLYILAGNRQVPKKLFNGTIKASQKMNDLLSLEPPEMSAETHEMFEYGASRLGYPVYGRTVSKYFSSGREWFEDYIGELKRAEKFIFMEFFIIYEGECLNRILEVLKQKAAEGVDIKLIYDDFGCVTLPRSFMKKLREYGIEAYRFNKLRPAFIIQMNNRDHRKITVIDNRVAYTGGVNIADEYIGKITRFGEWKDSALKLTGDAVWSMTVMFLGMYTYVSGKEIDFEQYHERYVMTVSDGLYQPFSDTPTDSEPAGLNMHQNMISRARNYIYIDTPYLIPNQSIMSALCLAAKSGVDVRILTPHIPDKKLVFQITRGNYDALLDAGVRIYEYTPGFNHAKNFVSDNKWAIVGSVNMDYRSYFLHFENGILMYDSDQIREIRNDFLQSLEKSHEVTREESEQTPLPLKVVRAVLNLFVPLV